MQQQQEWQQYSNFRSPCQVYHGWEFSGSGACERIPQGGLASSPRACLAAYPVEVRQGLVWARPVALPRGLDSRDSAAGIDTSDIPIVPELEDPEWVSQDTWRDLPYDYSTLMENVVDSSHALLHRAPAADSLDM
ncbi:pheophorbide a oxygenase [Haematococcus lacustris]|uniref:Pheophorbide a oxygenase n=1 Tax=Haematococcus lacustris TaxID=44745 RepID=A0A699Z2S0_HAELA|nr:pheophorbide a oxygenase [Haematococcus lacustris]